MMKKLLRSYIVCHFKGEITMFQSDKPSCASEIITTFKKKIAN